MNKGYFAKNCLPRIGFKELTWFNENFHALGHKKLVPTCDHVISISVIYSPMIYREYTSPGLKEFTFKPWAIPVKHNNPKCWISRSHNKICLCFQGVIASYDYGWVSRNHYSDVIMGTIASQITSLTIVYSTAYSGADQRKHQSSTSLAFVWGIHRWPVNSLHNRPVTRKMFPFGDVIMLRWIWGFQAFITDMQYKILQGQDCSISIANALEILQFCTKLLICLFEANYLHKMPKIVESASIWWYLKKISSKLLPQLTCPVYLMDELMVAYQC